MFFILQQAYIHDRGKGQEIKKASPVMQALSKLLSMSFAQPMGQNKSQGQTQSQQAEQVSPLEESTAKLYGKEFGDRKI